MKPIRITYQGAEGILACAHWRTFPPITAFYETTPEDLRARKVLKETDYQRYKIWERICNRKVMDGTECLICPHARLAEIRNGLPVLVSLDGLIVVPTVDLPTLEVNIRQAAQQMPGSGPPRVKLSAIRRMPGDPNG